MKGSTIFIVILLLLAGFGAYWLLMKPENSSSELLLTEKPIFTPEDVCELLEYSPDGKAGFLVKRGYREVRHESYEKYFIWGNDFVVFPIEKKGRIIFSSDPKYNLYHIIFEGNQEGAYLKFLSQFPKITIPFPKQNEIQGTEQQAVGKCRIQAFGFKREANGYLISCEATN